MTRYEKRRRYAEYLYGRAFDLEPTWTMYMTAEAYYAQVERAYHELRRKERRVARRIRQRQTNGGVVMQVCGITLRGHVPFRKRARLRFII